MSINKLPCGGFYYDSSTMVIDNNNVLKLRPIAEKITDYLYTIEYTNYDYTIGKKYVDKYKNPAMCSAVRKNNIVGRNYDWYYGEEVQFVIKTKACNKRHATLGVVHSNLTTTQVDSGEWFDYYDAMPFMVNDCINDKGVYVNINVVSSGDKGFTIGTNPNKEDLSQLMIPRYICDYADSADHAIELLRERNIYAPLGLGFECHFLICDKDKTYIVEFIDNEMYVTSNDIMLNFYLHGWNGEIKSACLGDSEADIEATGLNLHAMGLERYNVLYNGLNDVSDEDDMAELMEEVKYTNLYNETQNPIWYSEFCEGDLTIYSQPSDFADILNKAVEEYKKHERNKKLWYTAHTSIYDIENKKLTLYVEEDYDNKYEFQLHINGKL